MFRPIVWLSHITLFAAFCLVSAATLSAKEEKAADKEDPAAKTLKELAEAVPRIWAEDVGDVGDTDVRITEVRKKARVQLHSLFDRRLKMAFPVKNVFGGDKGVYVIATGSPAHFPCSRRWPLWVPTASRLDDETIPPAGNYVSYPPTLLARITQEQALQIDRSCVLEISGTMEVRICPHIESLNGQYDEQCAPSTYLSVLCWVNQGAAEMVSVRIDNPNISIVDGTGKEIIILRKAKETRSPTTTKKSASLPDKEHVAAAKLKTAESLIAINPGGAKERLAQIVKHYPDTKAAKEAKEMLRIMGE